MLTQEKLEYIYDSIDGLTKLGKGAWINSLSKIGDSIGQEEEKTINAVYDFFKRIRENT
jgi:hypothetical protein